MRNAPSCVPVDRVTSVAIVSDGRGLYARRSANPSRQEFGGARGRAQIRSDGVLKPLAAAIGLAALLIAIYGPGIGKGFVKDDVVWVGANRVASWSDARALLLRTDGFYRPVVGATFALDRAVYGLEPFGFGITNLCLLLLGAFALAFLGTSLGLSAAAAVIAAGVWALNFHAVNMAVLWLSGRTALCVSVAAFVAAAGVVRQRPIAAGAATLVAMLAKEEAVMLPFILAGWAWVLAGTRSQPPAATWTSAAAVEVVRRTWPAFAQRFGVAGPAWLALAIYLTLRAQTAAMTPMTAPEAYRFVLAPAALAANAVEYLDRACTFSLIVIVAAHAIAWRRPMLTEPLRRVLILGSIWFVGTFALTLFVPNRSSLYALLPSAAPALVTGFALQQLWDATAPIARRRLIAAAVIVPVLLLPVYWSRNERWIEIAELSSDTFAAVRQVTRERPDVNVLLFRDDRSTRRSFADAYDELLPNAVRLAAGREIKTDIVAPGEEHREGVVIALRDRKVVVE